ncbi:MAG: DmsE family decaheme c-type cytochrome [Deltaproteobacteria bacterium]|nr:DmsE family decaheme c-type cytochrome [Deltaproteobacteria bacterium]
MRPDIRENAPTKPGRRGGWLLVPALAILAACGALKAREPLGTLQEYKEMLLGHPDAQYVGTDRCLEACHTHDARRNDLANSTMGQQPGSAEGEHRVDCESCHGPGSLAIAGLDHDEVEAAAARGIKIPCRYETLTPIKRLPAGAQDLMCLNCHSSSANPNLHDWAASSHATAEVTCTNCHPIHAGPDMLISFRDQSDLCLKCHEDQRAKMAMPSRHPVMERKMGCNSCHEPHGSGGAESALVRPTVRETCGSCHGDKIAPFSFAHADVIDDCETCHDPHGAPNDDMLVATEPFLCMQCHVGHPVDAAAGPSSLESKAAFYTRCSNCHSTLHGSHLPSPSGSGTFIR